MKLAFLFLAMILFSNTLKAQVYVSTTGSDITGDGTVDRPYRTIVYAVNASLAGNTIFISPGTYFQISEVYINKALTLVKNGTSAVVIDAVNRNGPEVGKYIIGIASTSNVVIDGITLKNCIGNGAKAIYVVGSGSDVTIKNCTITNIGWVSNNLSILPPNSGTIANATRVEGSSASPLQNIFISNNDISNCATGWGEAVTITGNVDTFTIQNNVVHEIANIGIVAAGNYPTGAPVASNQSRNGIIRNNEVYNCMSGIATSAGIYIDGAINITVERNKVYGNAAGISVGAEVTIPVNASPVAGHIIRNNLIYENSIAGIFIGSANAANSILNCTFSNNTCYGNVTAAAINGITNINGSPVGDVANGSSGDVLLFNSSNATFQNNIIWPLTGRKAIVGMADRIVTNFITDYNIYFRNDNTPLYFFAAGHVFNGITGQQTYNNIADFNIATGLDSHSLFGMPGFTNTALYNFIPTTGALVIDKGNPVYSSVNSGFTDFADNQRLYNGIRIDVGAYEYQGGSFGSVTYTFTGNGNWNVPSNWSSNMIPPAVLTPGSQILVDPVSGGECILNISQTIMPGSSVTVIVNKKLKILGRLTMQ